MAIRQVKLFKTDEEANKWLKKYDGDAFRGTSWEAGEKGLANIIEIKSGPSGILIVFEWYKDDD